MKHLLFAVVLLSLSACSQAPEPTAPPPPAKPNPAPPSVPAPTVPAPAPVPAATPVPAPTPAPVTQGQQPLVDFQASTFHTGDPTWKDRAHGVVATVIGSPLGNGRSITTDNGSFVFNTDDAKLTGLKSYTLAVGFTATSITTGGAFFYGGNGLLGADIPGVGQGDSGISLTTDGSGQIIGGLGVSNNDSNLYSHNVTDGGPGYYVSGSANGAVLVVDGSAGPGNGVVSLYVNGHLSPVDQFGQITGLTILPFGSNNGTAGNFQYGIGAIANGSGSVGSGGTLKGSITQVQIYGSALSDKDAIALSLSIAKPSGLSSSSQ